MHDKEVPVLIVGGSLVGMSTALLLGHHGVFSLSPIFIFSLIGLWRSIRARGDPLEPFALLTALLTLLLLVFYVFFAGQRNYGEFAAVSAGFSG